MLPQLDLAEMFPEVTTVEQVTGLPVGTVLYCPDPDGGWWADVYHRIDHAGLGYPPDEWPGGMWEQTGSDTSEVGIDIPLPAYVLWFPNFTEDEQ